MDIIERFKSEAKGARKRLVLPEGFDSRTIEAAREILQTGLAELIVLGDRDKISKALPKTDKLTVIDPLTSPKRAEYTEIYYNLRKAKGLTEEEAEEALKSPLFFGAMLVKNGEAAGSVAGAANNTADVLKAGLRVIGPAKGIKTVSSFFIMVTDTAFGEEGTLFFADCAVVVNPKSEELSEIAVATAANFHKLMGKDPRLGFLSFSTKGSANTPESEKVREAARLTLERAPRIISDGELQLDAAIVAEVAERKSKGSAAAGRANVLIFPTLDAGNIGYKLAERLGGAKAIGPVIQGFARPVNDLSRGASHTDIVNMAAITALQAE